MQVSLKSLVQLANLSCSSSFARWFNSLRAAVHPIIHLCARLAVLSAESNAHVWTSSFDQLVSNDLQA